MKNKKRWKRFLFGSGGFAENTMQNAPSVLVNPIYNVGLGVSPVIIGMALAIPRFWELILDPWIGVKSDKTESRWGRRKPYIIPGAITSSLFFILIWWVPTTWSPTAQGVWLVTFSFLFFTGYSFFAIPYAALALELTSDADERMRIMAVRNVFAMLGTLPINWLYWLCQRSVFSSPMEGIRYVGTGFGLLIGIAALLPLFVSSETTPETTKLTSPSQAFDINVVKKILLLRPFQWLLLSLLALLTGFTLVGNLGFYLVVFQSCQGNKDTASLILGISGTVGTLLGMAACPLVSFLSNRFGKHLTLLVFLALACLGSFSMWWSINPNTPYAFIASSIPIAFGMAAYWTIAPALLGDISDAFTTQTGLAYQGLFASIYGIAVKVGVSLSLMVTGYVLLFCDFDSQLSQIAMHEPLKRMGLLYATIPCAGIAVAAWAIKKLWGKINLCSP
jgi:glycoside/pentoside/hexuronide:cation symporter, GPH family